MSNDHVKHGEFEGEELNRRKFLVLAGNTALVAGLAGLGIFSVDMMSPTTLKEPALDVNVGTPDKYAPGSITMLSEHKVYVCRKHDGSFYALTMICAHLGCITGYRQGAAMIVCPCHGSRYNPEDGAVISGPAPRPLTSLRMSLSDRGELWVHRGDPVAQGTTIKS